MNNIGIFTSGGDAPGMNACIRAVTRTVLYNNRVPYGIKRGYTGLIDGDIDQLDSDGVSNIIQQGGTILKSARCEYFRTHQGRKEAYQQIKKHEIDALIAIGGDGTFTGMKVFYEEYKLPCIGIPGTIDNDLYGTDYTIGFDTAVNTAITAIDKIRDTAHSHDRAFLIEVMGHATGYIAIQTGISTGAKLVIVPESTPSIENIIETLEDRGEERCSYLIVVAERNQLGSINDLKKKIEELLPHLDIRVTTLGHIQRGGSPTANDRILASRLGFAAVNGLLNGKLNMMVGVVGNKITYVPFSDSISKKKALDRDLLKMVNILSI